MNNLIKFGLFSFLILFAGVAFSQDGTIYPLETPKEPNAILLGTGTVANQPAPETWFKQWGDPMARNISTATLTPFLPEPGKANGTAVLVAPGGGPTPPTLEDFSAWMNRPRNAPPAPGAAPTTPAPSPLQRDLTNQLQDAEAAYALMVKNAKEWGIDTSRIGMIGFSAGAGLTMHATLHSTTMKLAFIGPIYGGMGPVDVPKDAPPMFNVIATDDFLFQGQFGIIQSWHKAGRPVELHLYQNGGHGFGLGNPNRTSNRWFDAFVHWLDVNKFMGKK